MGQLIGVIASQVGGGGMGMRHRSVDYDQGRTQQGSGLQMFYQNQRRPNEAEQMAQAKRRMAAQRERELRNYHQEQQHNRSKLFSGKRCLILTMVFSSFHPTATRRVLESCSFE